MKAGKCIDVETWEKNCTIELLYTRDVQKIINIWRQTLDETIQMEFSNPQICGFWKSYTVWALCTLYVLPCFFFGVNLLARLKGEAPLNMNKKLFMHIFLTGMCILLCPIII